MARRAKPVFPRFVAAWFLVTLATWVAFLAAVGAASLRFDIWRAILVGEVVVVAAEGFLIPVMLRSRFLAGDPAGAPTLLRALAMSAIANGISFGGSYLAYRLQSVDPFTGM